MHEKLKKCMKNGKNGRKMEKMHEKCAKSQNMYVNIYMCENPKICKICKNIFSNLGSRGCGSNL
jgi:hypothetical protein